MEISKQQYREEGHLSGHTQYIPDKLLLHNTLTARVVCAPYAHAKLIAYHLEKARAVSGVQAILSASDIKGKNLMSIIANDEPCLMPLDTSSSYMGQAVFLIAANTEDAAIRAEKAIEWEWEPLEGIFTIEKAKQLKNYLFEPLILERGRPQQILSEAKEVLQGHLSIGGQEHMYFEAQSAYVIPQGNEGMKIYSSTQNPTDTQMITAQVLDMSASKVEVNVSYLGGGFGGKQCQGSWTAVWASLLAQQTRQPILLVLPREQDMQMTGKRHAVEASWKAIASNTGIIQAVDIEMDYDCGWCTDMSSAVMHHSMFHIDNAYYLENIRIICNPCKTNKTSSTAFRGFGVPQAVAVMESIITSIANHIKKDPAKIRLANYYGKRKNNLTPCSMIVKNNVLKQLHKDILSWSQYDTLRKEIKIFNQKHPYVKRGIAQIPIKFGISFNESFLNQAGALLNIYKDGTLIIHHAGTEMGQGLNDKMRIIVSQELGIDIEKIQVNETSTAIIPNTTSTAASTGTDFGGAALKDACDKLKKRLNPVALKMMQKEKGQLRWKENRIFCQTDSIAFNDLITYTYNSCESLSEKGFFSRKGIGFDLHTMQGKPYSYYVMGMAVSYVQVDVLTGSFRNLANWILHDSGISIDPRIDRGQVMGAFVQGIGWCTLEKLITDNQGKLLTDSFENYKIPSIYNLPENCQIRFFSQNPEQSNIHGTRAIGEPPLIYSLSVWLALQDAVGSQLPIPATCEYLIKKCY